jgi:hypothetical protein
MRRRRGSRRPIGSATFTEVMSLPDWSSTISSDLGPSTMSAGTFGVPNAE